MDQLVLERPKIAFERFTQHYQVAGLRVCSTFAVTNLATSNRFARSFTADGQADCFIELHQSLSAAAISEAENLAKSQRQHDSGEEPALVDAAWLRVYQLPAAWLVRVCDTVDFVWEPLTTRLTVHPLTGASHREVEHFLVATMLPLICTLEDKLVLHASSVEHAGRVVLFIGASGSGKSTAAYLAGLHGWRIFADDFVVIEKQSLADGGSEFIVHRGSNELRLRQDIVEKYSLTSSTERAGKFALIPAATDSREMQASSGALAAVFFLQESSDQISQEQSEQISISASSAFRLLLQQVFFSFIFKPEQTAFVFETLSTLVTQTPHRSLNTREEGQFIQALIQVEGRL